MRKAMVPALLILVMTLAGCSQSANVQVNLKNFVYTPPEVSIKVGDRVTWNNIDIEPHTVTSEAWDSGAINPGRSYSRTFDTPGTSNTNCQFHPDMVGKITVTAENDKQNHAFSNGYSIRNENPPVTHLVCFYPLTYNQLH